MHLVSSWRSKLTSDWKIVKKDKEKNAMGYVGIKNLGASKNMQFFFFLKKLL